MIYNLAYTYKFQLKTTQGQGVLGLCKVNNCNFNQYIIFQNISGPRVSKPHQGYLAHYTYCYEPHYQNGGTSTYCGQQQLDGPHFTKFLFVLKKKRIWPYENDHLWNLYHYLNSIQLINLITLLLFFGFMIWHWNLSHIAQACILEIKCPLLARCVLRWLPKVKWRVNSSMHQLVLLCRSINQAQGLFHA